MSRLSFRPRPLDIHKKLPIVKSVKDFEDDDGPTPTRNSHHLLRIPPEVESEVHQSVTKKNAADIPTPQYLVVDTYERDYLQTFSQPTSYLRARGVRAEITEFVEYDLDNEDEDWLDDFNELDPSNKLPPEKLESILFKFEVLDHKARERAGIITPTLGAPIPVILHMDSAFEHQVAPLRYEVFEAIFEYWKMKRERWQKPILRRLQPPPPVNDTNPYNVFRPREKAHRLHTRRMQRRENNVHSFEKLRQVRRNLDQAKSVLEALIKREEKKRESMEIEVSLQRLQWKYKNETDILEDSLGLSGFPTISSKFASSDDELESDDVPPTRPRGRPPAHASPFADSNLYRIPRVTFKQGARRRHTAALGWLNKMDPHEPILLFTKPLIPEKLAAAGIVPPAESPANTPYRFHGRVGHVGRVGRGGRIIFDRVSTVVNFNLNGLPK